MIAVPIRTLLEIKHPHLRVVHKCPFAVATSKYKKPFTDSGHRMLKARFRALTANRNSGPIVGN
jgi:hypothetical protein